MPLGIVVVVGVMVFAARGVQRGRKELERLRILVIRIRSGDRTLPQHRLQLRRTPLRLQIIN